MPHKMAIYLNWMHSIDSRLCICINRTSQSRWIRKLFRLVSRLGNGLF
jgi:undecaprenyl-diphosphatase